MAGIYKDLAHYSTNGYVQPVFCLNTIQIQHRDHIFNLFLVVLAETIETYNVYDAETLGQLRRISRWLLLLVQKSLAMDRGLVHIYF